MNSKNSRGFSFIELIITLAIIGILASIVMPLSKIAVRRNREFELRRSLREMRKAIDNYKDKFDELKKEYYTKKKNENEELYKRFKVDEFERTGYPFKLEDLVETKLLRRIPRDSFSEDGQWVTRSYSDDVNSKMTNGKDVYDVRSSSEEIALDGTKYCEW